MAKQVVESQGYLENDLQFHLECIKGAPQILDLPCDFPRPAVFSGKGAHLNFPVAAAVANKSRLFAKTLGITEFHLLLSVFGSILTRFSRQDDLLVATPLAGRDAGSGIENLIGFFVETVPIRISLVDGQDFKAFAKRVSESVIGALAHPNAPFDKIVSRAEVKRDESRPQLCQVMFTVEVDGDVNLSLDKVASEQVTTDQAGSKFEITLDISKKANGEYEFHWEFATDLFRSETIEEMHACFVSLLEHLEANASSSVDSMDMISKPRLQQLIRGMNDPAQCDYSGHLKVHERFSEMAKTFPDETCCVFKDTTMTYSELERKAQALAARLQSMGVKNGAGAVTTLLDRDLNTPVVYFGILYAGGFYVPISPEYPPERITYMATDSCAKVIITQKALEKFIPEDVECPRILIDDFNFDDGALDYTPRNDQEIAYMTYTSGSTGNPKGVLVPHSGVMRLVVNTNYFAWSTDSVVLQHSPVTFDATTFELYGPALNGGKVVLFHDASTNLDEIERTILKHKCNFLFFTARLYDVLVDRNSCAFHPDVKVACCGGEALSLSHVNAFCTAYPHIQMMNVYGPTEVTSLATYYHFPKGTSSPSTPIGRPIMNTACYVVDKHLRIVPRGVCGELVLGGPGVAHGYWQRPEKTASVFVPNPFVSGSTMYRTGDLVRLNHDDNLEFWGAHRQAGEAPRFSD